MPDPKPNDVDFHEETDSPSYADDRNFYKVEMWTRDWTKVDSLLYAGNSLGRARSIFRYAIKHRPRIRLTIRQRTRVLDQWAATPTTTVGRSARGARLSRLSPTFSFAARSTFACCRGLCTIGLPC
jgi:hypothetical protein